MPGKIYLIQNDKSLQALTQQPYPNEDDFQALLEQYPDLLAGDQMNEAAPRRWLLVAREMGVPGVEGGPDQWSLDHLFLDQDGIPTLVEVKRAGDTRIRREVVGQMLDYAANAVVYWPVETVQAHFEATCARHQADPAQLLADLLGVNPDDGAALDVFWSQVKTNLQAAKIRLVFVADEIPPELRRIVEFLNATMDPVEVLAVEIHQYVGQGLKTLVSRVMGQTTDAQARKGAGSRQARTWDEVSFFAELERRHGTEKAAAARKILDWTQERTLRLWWGQGSQDGSFFPMLDHNGITYWLISVWTYGRVEMQFQMMKKQPPLDDLQRREELRARLNEIRGIAIPPDGLERRPSFSLAALCDDAAMKQFLAVLDWMVAEIRRA
jgi:hypothetical protein